MNRLAARALAAIALGSFLPGSAALSRVLAGPSQEVRAAQPPDLRVSQLTELRASQAPGLRASQAPRSLASPAVISVRDTTGGVVSLRAPALRIVSLAPHTTELLFAVGAGDRVVGVSQYSDFPAAAQRLPQVGDAVRLDFEAIVALHPDLVVAWASALAPPQRMRLAQLGIPVFLSEPRELDDVARDLRALGELTATRTTAQAAADQLTAEFAAARRQYAGLRPVSVFFQVWDPPLMTINGQQLISAMLTLCGARNIFAAEHLLAPTVDRESVVRADPELVLTGVRGADPKLAHGAFSRWAGLTRMQAVRHGRLIALDEDPLVRPGPRVALAVHSLCTAIDAVRSGSSAKTVP